MISEKKTVNASDQCASEGDDRSNSLSLIVNHLLLFNQKNQEVRGNVHADDCVTARQCEYQVFTSAINKFVQEQLQQQNTEV